MEEEDAAASQRLLQPQPVPGGAAMVMLSANESVLLHGWWNPKRTLSWDDVVSSDRITVKMLVRDAKFTQQRLKSLQPDIYEWIHRKYVSFGEVPFMTGFPLDPIRHLNGDLSTLVAQRYPCDLLLDLGYTYRWLRQAQRMDSKWMKLLCFTPWEWTQLGMTEKDVEKDFSEEDAWVVFGTSKAALAIRMGVEICRNSALAGLEQD